MNKSHLATLALASIYMSAVGAEGTDLPGDAQAAPQEVPTSTEPEVATAEKKVRAPKDPAKALDIINGRMPLPLVYCIRFKEAADAKASAIAKEYGTSVGKAFDIRKGSNFGYITESYKPSAEELAAARAFITTGTSQVSGKTLSALGGAPDKIEAFLAQMEVASPEEVAARGWQVKSVGEKAPVDPNAPVEPKAPKAPRKAKAKAPAAAPVAAAGASMF